MSTKPILPELADPSHKDDDGDGINERLISTRTILLTGTVNDALARRVLQSLLVLEAEDPEKPITLLINSGGGSVTSGFGIYDMVRWVRAPVRCISAGLTASIATVVLLAVPRERRVALPNARLLIHQPLIPMSIFGPASDLEITAAEIMKTKARINAVLSEECGQPLSRVEKDTARDHWMSAEEAMEYGMVSRIVRSRTDLEG